MSALSYQRQRKEASVPTVLFRMACFIAAITIYAVAGSAHPAVIWAAFSPACQIKGNISISTGQRIYHLPNQLRYLETTISPRYGERWFCTAEDAEAAGWRRARS